MACDIAAHNPPDTKQRQDPGDDERTRNRKAQRVKPEKLAIKAVPLILLDDDGKTASSSHDELDVESGNDKREDTRVQSIRDDDTGKSGRGCNDKVVLEVLLKSGP